MASKALTTVDVESWLEEEEEEKSVEPILSTDPAEKYAKSQIRVIRETKDYQLDYLRHALSPLTASIDTSPGYQRRLRWTNKKRSMLIESFLLNIPVPPVFLYEHDYNEYEVIDGRQRLETIRAFLRNDFALSGLEYWPELDRLRFNQLPLVLQKGLLRRSLQAVVLLAETADPAHDNLDVRRVLFDRLNTGGIRLNPQELRNALYPGSLNAMLIRLARSAPFTLIFGIPSFSTKEESEPSEELLKNVLFSTLTDAELVLRFFALRDAVENNGKGALRRILDRFMQKHANAGPTQISAWETEFQSLITALHTVFGESTFRLPTTNRVSRPLFDSLMVALSLHPGLDVTANGAAIRDSMYEALEDKKQYEILVGRGNTIESVHQRVALAEKILTGQV